jgi:hypothetical protein
VLQCLVLLMIVCLPFLFLVSFGFQRFEFSSALNRKSFCTIKKNRAFYLPRYFKMHRSTIVRKKNSSSSRTKIEFFSRLYSCDTQRRLLSASPHYSFGDNTLRERTYTQVTRENPVVVAVIFLSLLRLLKMERGIKSSFLY